MTAPSEDLPPPYAPSKAATASNAAASTSPVPRWIVTHAIVVKPLGWFLQRIVNGAELLDEHGKQSFDPLLLMFTVWSSLSLLVVAMVDAGGTHAWAKPEGRPRLLRTGLGCGIVLNVVLTGIAILLIGAALASPQQADNEPFGGPADVAGVVAIPIWVACFAMDCLAWRRLRPVHH